jgi:hypothetical protein
MAEQEASLVALLTDSVDIRRYFWIAARAEQRQLMRVRLLWQFLKDVIEANQPWLMGESKSGLLLPPEKSIV